jgi:hypothetical protein
VSGQLRTCRCAGQRVWELPPSDREFPRLAPRSGTQRARDFCPSGPVGSGCAPALLGGLAGDAEPGADLGPGVAAGAQALDGFGYGGVDLLGQAEHEGQGLDVAVPDAAAVCAQDAAGECGVLVILDVSPWAI